MHFTILGNNFTLTANFAPCLIWSNATEHSDQPYLWNQHPDHPGYDKGDLLEAVKHFNIREQLDKAKAVLVIHDSGQAAEQKDCDAIVEDCNEVFEYVTVLTPWKKSAV
ncbi:MAG: hypothetical protein H8E91_00160 [Planctomycetes bacterium]|nr:hypothetical protein [Planctomycetota bacterium]